MGDEQASQIVQAPGTKTNQDELARPPMMRYSIEDEYTGYFSENRKRDNAVLNAATERSGAASFQILPPKPAEVFRTPEECHSHVTKEMQPDVHRLRGSAAASPLLTETGFVNGKGQFRPLTESTPLIRSLKQLSQVIMSVIPTDVPN